MDGLRTLWTQGRSSGGMCPGMKMASGLCHLLLLLLVSLFCSLSLSLVLSLFHSQEQLSSFFQASENEGSNYSQIWEPTVQTPRQKWVSLSGFQNL